MIGGTRKRDLRKMSINIIKEETNVERRDERNKTKKTNRTSKRELTSHTTILLQTMRIRVTIAPMVIIMVLN